MLERKLSLHSASCKTYSTIFGGVQDTYLGLEVEIFDHKFNIFLNISATLAFE
jgi:hypothetical protein